jgi:hypothetical protein
MCGYRCVKMSAAWDGTPSAVSSVSSKWLRVCHFLASCLRSCHLACTSLCRELDRVLNVHARICDPLTSLLACRVRGFGRLVLLCAPLRHGHTSAPAWLGHCRLHGLPVYLRSYTASPAIDNVWSALRHAVALFATCTARTRQGRRHALATRRARARACYARTVHAAGVGTGAY